MHKDRKYKIEVTSPGAKVFQVEEEAISEKEALLKMMFKAERTGKVADYATEWQDSDAEDETTRKVATLVSTYKVCCKFC